MDEFLVGKFYTAFILEKDELSEKPEIWDRDIRYLDRLIPHAENDHLILVKYLGDNKFEFHNVIISGDWLGDIERVYVSAGDL